MSIEQVVTLAGDDGKITDDSKCSLELRSYFSEITSAKIESYADHCLTKSFQNSGRVLQDLVNELGRRLDYKVTNGRYQGTTKTVGFDGLWLAEGHTIIAEVKTTDAYRISLDTIASYRDKLLAKGEIADPSSILIIVGRDDTGELEAQVRGSPHAWDIRLIGISALLRLVKLKEDAEDQETGKKVRSLLVPREFTRLDGMIDVMFAAAKDAESAVEAEAGQDEPPTATEATSTKGTWQFTDSALLQKKRESIISALSQREGTSLIKSSRALYWNSTHDVRAACTISKRYLKKGASPYWYAYHPQWDDFLSGAAKGYLVLGCMDKDQAIVLPLSVIRDCLSSLHETERDDGKSYWHLHIAENSNDDLELLLPKKKSSLALSAFVMPLSK